MKNIKIDFFWLFIAGMILLSWLADYEIITVTKDGRTTYSIEEKDKTHEQKESKKEVKTEDTWEQSYTFQDN